MTNVADTDATAISDERLAEMLAGLEGVTRGKWCQFHPSYCEEAKDTPFSEWDTSHHLSAVANGHRVRIGEFRHSADAAHVDYCDPDTMRALITELQERRRNTLPSSVTDEQAVWELTVNGQAHTFPLPEIVGGQIRILIGAKLDDTLILEGDETDQLIRDEDVVKLPAILHLRPQTLFGASLPPSREDAQVGVRVKPVGWRVRERPGFIWHFTDMDPDRDPRLRDHEKQPLYAEPAQQPIDRATVIEECVKVARFVQSQWGSERQAEAGAVGGLAYILEHMAKDAKPFDETALRALTDKEPTNV